MAVCAPSRDELRDTTTMINEVREGYKERGAYEEVRLTNRRAFERLFISAANAGLIPREKEIVGRRWDEVVWPAAPSQLVRWEDLTMTRQSLVFPRAIR